MSYLRPSLGATAIEYGLVAAPDLVTEKPKKTALQRRIAARNRTRARSVGVADLGSAVTDLVGSDVVTMGAAAALVYHGYRRTGSIVWALLYGLAGKKYPVIAVPVAIAQGFGKPRHCDL